MFCSIWESTVYVPISALSEDTEPKTTNGSAFLFPQSYDFKSWTGSDFIVLWEKLSGRAGEVLSHKPMKSDMVGNFDFIVLWERPITCLEIILKFHSQILATMNLIFHLCAKNFTHLSIGGNDE